MDVKERTEAIFRVVEDALEFDLWCSWGASEVAPRLRELGAALCVGVRELDTSWSIRWAPSSTGRGGAFVASDNTLTAVYALREVAEGLVSLESEMGHLAFDLFAPVGPERLAFAVCERLSRDLWV